MMNKITTKQGRRFFIFLSFFTVFFLWGIYVMILSSRLPVNYSVPTDEVRADGCATKDPFITRARCSTNDQ